MLVTLFHEGYLKQFWVDNVIYLKPLGYDTDLS